MAATATASSSSSRRSLSFARAYIFLLVIRHRSGARNQPYDDDNVDEEGRLLLLLHRRGRKRRVWQAPSWYRMGVNQQHCLNRLFIIIIMETWILGIIYTQTSTTTTTTKKKKTRNGGEKDDGKAFSTRPLFTLCTQARKKKEKRKKAVVGYPTPVFWLISIPFSSLVSFLSSAKGFSFSTGVLPPDDRVRAWAG